MKKIALRHALYLAIIIGLVVLYKVCDITCPILHFTKVPCPTCGTTRALISLFTGDIRGYVYYQPLAVPLCITVVFLIHLRLFPKYAKWIPIAFSALTLTLNTALYIYRLCLLFG